MALNSRLPARARIGPQRPKINGNENAVVNKHVRQQSGFGFGRVVSKVGPQRPAFADAVKNASKEIAKITIKETTEVDAKRARAFTVAAPTGPQRVPLGTLRTTANGTSQVNLAKPLPTEPLRPQRPTSIYRSETAPELRREPPQTVPVEIEDESEDMEIEEEDVVRVEPEEMDEQREIDEVDRLAGEVEDAWDAVPVARIWPELSPEAAYRYKKEIDEIRRSFVDEVDEFDTTMVSEYSNEIFEYMEALEIEMMPNPIYMEGQKEISWDMRAILIDWLISVHLRYHMLPETLWITVNLIDRFLSKRVVSVLKLQLVGLTAMFIAAKYEEVLAPVADEFVYLADKKYTRDEILKGERIILQTVDFKISSYCSPYSWMRRISKADDYDIQTRTLCKFLVEVSLLDYRFLRAKPSLVAAVGMYTSRKMLRGDWNEAFVFYSGYTEEQLIPGHNYIIELLTLKGFTRQNLCKKYACKRFLKASLFAVEWARANGPMREMYGAEDMFLVA